ncbi:hypothetical protein DJ80_08280 [Halorubrum ezzemoulense]|uniref:Uncharacterized protein n=1 Tax=Halorubrum ezzemoulense TaxID=337243 RepID=A0A256J3G0_HALEZ|nr:hypothetical protein DJ80_08280 [Halorubrum ezzemoulense]
MSSAGWLPPTDTLPSPLPDDESADRVSTPVSVTESSRAGWLPPMSIVVEYPPETTPGSIESGAVVSTPVSVTESSRAGWFPPTSNDCE